MYENKSYIFIKNNYILNSLAGDFFKIYLQLKKKNYSVNSSLTLYDSFFKIKKYRYTLKAKNLLYLDFSRKQLYTTKCDLNRSVIYTSSNGSFLKKLTDNLISSKNQFFLKNEIFILFFEKLLKLTRKSSNLIVKGSNNDLNLFFQKLNRLKLTYFFINIIIKFNSNYNLNKKKRIRSIKKRFKKSFLKYENKTIASFLKTY